MDNTNRINPTPNHRAQVPAKVVAYFRDFHGVDVTIRQNHPVIAQAFTSKGWKTYPIRKRISPSWARKMRDEGVTAVALVVPELRPAVRVDFQIAELVK